MRRDKNGQRQGDSKWPWTILQKNNSWGLNSQTNNRYLKSNYRRSYSRQQKLVPNEET